MPQGYYLDINEKKYKKCYENCKSCYGEGNETYNNCDECKDNFTFYYNTKNIGNCYPICNNYYYFNELNNFICTIINENITQKIFTTSSNSQIIYQCKVNNNFNDYCDFLNSKEDTEIFNIIQQNINLIFDLDKEKSQIINGGDDIIYQITNTKNEKELLKNNSLNTQNLTILDLDECENKLKKEYNISDNDSLIYLKKENINVNPSEKDFNYEIYEPYTFKKLNLSICNDENINIYIPITLSDETRNVYEKMKSLGYNMFDINDPFYQDLCTPYKTENSTDIPLSARIDYIYNNKDSKCQANCYFSSYLPNSLYINCTCNVEQKEEKEKIKKFSGNTLYEIFYDVLKYANFEILKCYNLIFDIHIFKNNIGNFIIIFIFSVYLICLILFIIKGIEPLRYKIKNLISKLNAEINNMMTKNISFHGKNRYKKNNLNKILPNPKRRKNQRLKNYKNIKNKISNKSAKLTNSSKNVINNSSKKNKSLFSGKEMKKLDEFELNQLEYDKALIYDKRSFIRSYWDIICREHIIIFTFFICKDYNIIYIKYARFLFLLTTDMAMNVFFFSDNSMHKIFLNYGKFNFIQQIPQVIYTTIISQLIEVFLCFLSLTDKHIYYIKKIFDSVDKKEIVNILKCIKIKLIIFFIITFILFAFYWYTVTIFCVVYENTQIIFVKDSLLSFLLSIVYPFIIYLIPSILRIISLRSSQKNLKCLYKLSDIIPFF